MAAGCTTIQFDEIQTYISHGHLPSKTIPSPFFAARCYANAACAVMRCLSVCLSVCPSITFVDSVETNKYIFKIVSPSGSNTILVFRHQTRWQYFDRYPLTGESNAGAVGKNCDYRPISGYRIDDGGVRTTTTTVHPAVYRTQPPRVSESLFITTSMDDHDEENKTEHLYAAVNPKRK